MKIIGLINPVAPFQEIYVYENGNKVDVVNSKVDMIADTVINLAKRYNVSDIELFGAKSYAAGISKQIQEAELSMYNKNVLNITIK